MCRDQMMDYIRDALDNADDRTLEQLYRFLALEIGE